MPAPRFLDAKGSFTPEEIATSPSARLITAASLAMGLISQAKAHTWAELGRDLREVPPHVLLEPWQVELLTENDEVLHLLHVKLRGEPDDVHTITIAACTSCHGWMAVSSATSVPGKCPLTMGCTGAMTKAAAAGPRGKASLSKTDIADDLTAESRDAA